MRNHQVILSAQTDHRKGSIGKVLELIGDPHPNRILTLKAPMAESQKSRRDTIFLGIALRCGPSQGWGPARFRAAASVPSRLSEGGLKKVFQWYRRSAQFAARRSISGVEG